MNLITLQYYNNSERLDRDRVYESLQDITADHNYYTQTGVVLLEYVALNTTQVQTRT